MPSLLEHAHSVDWWFAASLLEYLSVLQIYVSPINAGSVLV